MLSGGALLAWLDISPLYLPLLQVMVIGAGLQVVLLGILNVLFYLDRRRLALLLVGAFCALNLACTALTLQLGPLWYGYGFAAALLIVCVGGLIALDRVFERLRIRPSAGAYRPGKPSWCARRLPATGRCSGYGPEDGNRAIDRRRSVRDR